MSIDLIRGALAGLLFLIGLMLWNAWKAEHPEPKPMVAQQVTQANAAAIPQATLNTTPVAATAGQALPAQVATRVNATPIIVKTDVYQIQIDPVGGALINTQLTQYPVSLDDKNALTLFNNKAESYYTAESGLTSPQGPDYQQPAVYQSAQQQYRLQDGQNELVVPMVWRNNQGLEVTKTYTFTRGSYLVKVNFTVNNQSKQAWQGQFFAQLKRAAAAAIHPHSSLFQINPFVGVVVSNPSERYHKFTFAEMAKAPINQTANNGWMAMEQRYFLSAWVPDPSAAYQYNSQSYDNGNIFGVNMVGPSVTVAPGQTQSIAAKLYVGPTIAKNLSTVAPGLDLTVDYGFLWFIGKILFWLLDYIHKVVPNWGLSIIILTVFIKLCFFQLSAKSYRSMAAMRKLQPQLQQIKERYGDDRQKVGQMTMELYRKEKVNPMGGCLPILVQNPVFIALYWVLLESVQLRLAPFALWVHDLASPDPFYVLPILMGLTMFLQQKMSPPPPDPMMAKMMLFMPIMFTFFFLNFPAGLVLYWVVSNTISIVQQWVITKRYGK